MNKENKESKKPKVARHEKNGLYYYYLKRDK